MGVSDMEIQIQTQWSYEGLWIPYAAQIKGTVGPGDKAALERLLREALGIPTERQYWDTNG